jgi:hypothetical protein
VESNLTPTDKQYQQIVVDVPEDRVAEFHAFFARFLAAGERRRHRGRHGRPHRGMHRHGCGRRDEAGTETQAPEQAPATEQPTTTEL